MPIQIAANQEVFKNSIRELLRINNLTLDDSQLIIFIKKFLELADKYNENKMCAWYKDGGECWRDMPDTKNTCICKACMQYLI